MQSIVVNVPDPKAPDASKYVVRDQIKAARELRLDEQAQAELEALPGQAKLHRVCSLLGAWEDNTLDAADPGLHQGWEPCELTDAEKERSFEISKGNEGSPLRTSPIEERTKAQSQILRAKELGDLGEQAHYQHLHRQCSNVLY